MHLDIDRIKGLCFDVDGTLSDTDDLWVSRFEKVLHPFRFLYPRRRSKDVSRRLVMGMETPGNLVYYWLDRLHLDDEIARLFDWMAKRSAQKKKHEYWLIPGVREMLGQLGEHFPLSVVSARDERTTLAFLDHFELRDFFQVVVTSQTCTYTKPYPHPVLHAAEVMGVKPEDCLMIGDTTVDIRAGRSAGAGTVGVLCGFGDERELARAGADFILPTTADLVGLLLSKASS